MEPRESLFLLQHDASAVDGILIAGEVSPDCSLTPSIRYRGAVRTPMLRKVSHRRDRRQCARNTAPPFQIAARKYADDGDF
jgi:hypothetical protein